MSPPLTAAILVLYFGILLVIAWITGRKADTATFFSANKASPWYLVAFGMIGTTISGITFISVPGAVGKEQFSYFEVILGNLIGYGVVALVLLPLYYRYNLVSIYTYLEQRLGFWSYKTGSAAFLISRTIGAAFRLYLAVLVLDLFLFRHYQVPFEAVALITLGLIWLYTFKGGVKTIIWTDSLQTLFLISALIMTLFYMLNALGLENPGALLKAVTESPYSKVFFFEDPNASRYFWKKFLSGIFLVIVMVGLDQDLMQKNLTCRNIGEAQKNMFVFSGIFLFVNLLFLTLGTLLYLYAGREGFPSPGTQGYPYASSDYFYPSLALDKLGFVAGLLFLVGITASTYASSDSALAALTTAFCIDFLEFDKKDEATRERLKFWIHLGFSLLIFLAILVFRALQNDSVVNSVFKVAGYTYGPLLGLFAFGILTKRQLHDPWVPFVCLLSPLLCYVLNQHSKEWLNGYSFDFELLLVNGLLTFVGLLLLSKKQVPQKTPA
jgi:Na+/proline symporter